MNFGQKEKFERAQQAVNDGDYAAAEAILKPLWEAFPFEYDVFRLLNACYLAQENWPAAEALIMQFGATLLGEDYKNGELLQLYLAQKDLPKALEIASLIIAPYPDYYDSIANLGYHFKDAGFGQAFFDFLNGLALPGFNRHAALAVCSAEINNDYEAAIEQIEKGLEEQPADALLLSYLENFKAQLKLRLIQEARALLTDQKPGDAVEACKAVWQQAPGSVTAQEYYLSALACKKFPPFYWYFYHNNFAGPVAYSFRGILYLIFFIGCAFYYRDAKPAGSNDHLESVIWLFAGLSIPRYTLFPLVVQVLAFRYVPGYHLWKKPFDFIKGAILLGVWLLALHNGNAPDTTGFHYFLTACFVTYVFLFDFADGLASPVQKKLLREYTGLALLLAILSYFRLIPDIFLFFVFAAWLPPVLISTGWAFFQKYIDIHRQGDQEQTQEPEGSGEAPRTTIRLQLIFGLLAAAGFLCFLLTRYIPEPFRNPVMFSAIPIFLYGVTVALLCSHDAGNVRDMGWLWKNSKVFRWTVVFWGLGMLTGVLGLLPYAHTPLRSDWRWIPGVATFFLCWLGLGIYTTRQLKKP